MRTIAQSMILWTLLGSLAALGDDSSGAKVATDNDERIAAVVASELESLHASTAAELIPGSSARRLVCVGSFALPYSDGKGIIALVGLAPGRPGNLRLPTDMEYLRFTLGLQPDGTFQVAERPERADLVTAVERVLADEAKAMSAAEAALNDANLPLPKGMDSWRDALKSITYDARLPRARFAGEPSWSLMFGDWNEARGGWNMVLLDAALHPTMVNGRRP